MERHVVKTPGWSGVLAEQFAERVIEVADLRRAEMGWTRERTVAVVGATTDVYVDSIAESLRDAAAYGPRRVGRVPVSAYDEEEARVAASSDPGYERGAGEDPSQR